MGAGRSLEPEDCRVEMIRMKIIFRNAREACSYIVKAVYLPECDVPSKFCYNGGGSFCKIQRMLK